MNKTPKTLLGFDRRTVLQSMLAAAIAPAALSTIRTAGAQDAAALLKLSATAMAAVQSFVFSMKTVQGKSILLGNFELQGVDGAVQRPDKFRADITVGASILSLTVKVIGIGTKVWITNPMSTDQSFTEASIGGGDSSSGLLSSLLNPDRIFLAAVEAIQNPTIDGSEQIDGIDTNRIKGSVDLKTLPILSSIATPQSDKGSSIAGYLDLSPKTMIAWIDATGIVHRIQIQGAFTKEETNDVIREINLSQFNSPQTVEAPTPTAST